MKKPLLAKRTTINDPRKSTEYLENKKLLLEKAALLVLDYLDYKNELTALRKKLSLTKHKIIDTYVAYDLDASKNENSIYQSIEMRYVLHLHNLLEGSWHIQRQNTVVDFIEKVSPDTVVDMGFGVPSKYVKEAIKKGRPNITLCDIDDSAFIFSEALLDLWGSQNWRHQINFKKLNMDTGFVIPDQDLYLFQSSIEHVKDCTNYLKKHVIQSKYKSYFILSLPIGPITPEHYMEWTTLQSADEWVNTCGLEILSTKVIKVNPDVDLFADIHNFQYYDYFMLCRKQ